MSDILPEPYLLFSRHNLAKTNVIRNFRSKFSRQKLGCKFCTKDEQFARIRSRPAVPQGLFTCLYRNKHRLGKLPHCSALQIIFSGTVVYSGAEIFGHRGAMFGHIIESDFVSGNPSRAALIHSLLVIVDDA